MRLGCTSCTRGNWQLHGGILQKHWGKFSGAEANWRSLEDAPTTANSPCDPSLLANHSKGEICNEWWWPGRTSERSGDRLCRPESWIASFVVLRCCSIVLQAYHTYESIKRTLLQRSLMNVGQAWKLPLVGAAFKCFNCLVIWLMEHEMTVIKEPKRRKLRVLF